IPVHQQLSQIKSRDRRCRQSGAFQVRKVTEADMSESTFVVGTIERREDGSHVGTLERRFEGHDRAAVWAMLTEPSNLAQWLAQGTIEPRTGGRARIDFHDSGILIDSVVIEFDP